MKKHGLIFFCLFFFIGSATLTFGQGVSINQSMGGENLKSVSKARSIALTNTALSISSGIGMVSLFENNTVQTIGGILGVYGVIVGPSTGNFYANDYPRGFAGAGARAIGAFLMADATSEIFGREFADALGVDDKDVSLTDTKILIGEVLVLGGFVYNIISLNKSVEEFNNSKGGITVNVKPTMVNDKIAPVLSASLRF